MSIFNTNKVASIGARGRRGAPTDTANDLASLGPYVGDITRLLIGLAAKFSEAEVMEFLWVSSPDLAKKLQDELRPGRNGVSDIKKAIGQVARLEAKKGLDNMYRLNRMAADGELAVVWPVPPHLVDELDEYVPTERQFAGEAHLPPHLEDSDIRQLDEMLPEEIVLAFHGVRGILADGRRRQDKVTVRRSLVSLLQLLPEKPVVFLHHLPHLPPHAVVSEIGDGVEVVDVR